MAFYHKAQGIPVIHLDAGHDSNGNPQRLFVVLNNGFGTEAVVEEGYRGEGNIKDRFAKGDTWPYIYYVGQYKITKGQYRQTIKDAKKNGNYFE